MSVSTKTLLMVDGLLAPLNRLVLRFPPSVSTRANEGPIVLIKLMGMGSIIRLLSLCKRQHVDLSQLVLITFDSNREVCKLLEVPRCLFIRTNGLFPFLSDCLRTIKEVRHLRPSRIIDYERCSNAVSLFSLGLAGASGSLSVRFNTRPKTNSNHLCFNVNDLSFYEILMKGIEWMPGSVPHRQLRPPSERDLLKVIININCSTYLLARRYPRDFFREVIVNLHARKPAFSIFLTGSPAEHGYVQGLADELASKGIIVHNTAGSWSLHKLEEELRTASVFISGDSGPLHLATLFGVPTVAIWGPTQPGHFGYSNSQTLMNVSLALPCAPCFTHPRSRPAVACEGRISCLHDLGPNTIVHAALKLIDQHVSTPNILTPAASW